MSEQELIQALRSIIEQHAPPAPEPSQLAQEIVRRDTWRLRLIAGLSIMFLIAGIAGIFVVFYSLRNYLIISSSGIEQFVPDPRLRDAIFYWERTVNHSLELSMVCLAAFLLGLLSTIWLISSVRRATLSQINLSLLRLSEQIKHMGQLPGEPNRQVPEPATMGSHELTASLVPEPSRKRSPAFWAVALVVLVVIALLSIPEVQAQLEWVIRHVGIFLRHVRILLNLW